MISTPPEGFPWLDDWRPITIADDVDALEAELRREVSPAHPLYQVTCYLIARRATSDDFLFLTDHPQLPIAVVHLTWTKETSEKFPWCTGFQSWEELQQHWLKRKY